MKQISASKMVVFEASFRGSSELVVAREEHNFRIKKGAPIIRLATLKDMEDLAQIGRDRFLIEIAEGVHVLKPNKKYRKIQNKMAYFFPVFESALSVEIFKAQMMAHHPRIKGPGWKATFCSNGLRIGAKAIYDTLQKQWRFEQFRFVDASVCDYCKSYHESIDLCPFYGDPHVQKFLGEHLVQTSLFCEYAKETAGKWRLKLALGGAFRQNISFKEEKENNA